MAAHNNAAAPATCGLAIEVPLKAAYDPPGIEDVIDSPGARSDRNDATFEKDEMTSLLSVEPTLTADDTQAGVESWVRELPFPAATAVAMPTARRLSMGGL